MDWHTRSDPEGLLAVVHPPHTGIYRIERESNKPFSAIDWQFSSSEGFQGRFDDPLLSTATGMDGRFRMIYAASNAVGCFAETVARLRMRPGLRVRLVSEIQRNEDIDPAGIDAGVI